MEKSTISNNLLYNQKHFDLLNKLYRTSFSGSVTLSDIYSIITETAVDGLNIDRASYWTIIENKLKCINLYDRNIGGHCLKNELLIKDFSVYMKALKDGIAVVADHAQTNTYTQELKDSYLIPLGITDMIDLPIRENGVLTGVLCCEDRNNSHVWSDTDLNFARSIGDILSLMIEQNKRKEAEDKLLESQRKLSLITKNSSDGFVVYENDKFTYISPSYATMLGYRFDEILNMSLNDILKRIHLDDVKQVKSIIKNNIAKQIKNFKYVFRIRIKSGTYIWREDTASVVYDEAGKYDKYIVISRDVSAVKKAEDEIQRLFTISKSLNEKLLDFTHIISHNIRSNTSNMSMIIDLIDDTDSQKEKAEYFELLKESNNKLSDTIHYLNETVNIQLIAKDQKVKLNLKSIIQKTLLTINGIIKKEKAEIRIDVPVNMEIENIPSYLESIMFNLISNAIKYKSPERNPIVIIEAQKINLKYTIVVRDNGMGIDMKRNKDKLFGMYKTFHGNEDAVGLGLFMTKNHIEALGGTVEVQSEVGKGTEFKITFDEEI